MTITEIKSSGYEIETRPFKEDSPEEKIVKMEKPKIDTNFIERKSIAKTYRGHLISNIQKCIHDNNIEMQKVFEEELRIFNSFYPKQIVKNEIRIVEGWKGEGLTEIYKGFEEDFIIKEFIKDKETNEVSESTHIIPKGDVNKMLFIIKSLPLNEKATCYEISDKLGYPSWKDLWKERKQYFAYYYFPIKICEALKIIKYSGRGEITRII